MAAKKNSIIAKDVRHKSDPYRYGSRTRLETVCGAYALRNYGNSTKDWHDVTCPKCIKIQNDRKQRRERMDQMNVFTDAATEEQKDIAETVSKFISSARIDEVESKAKFFIQNCKETGLTPVDDGA
jgi:ssDNA-binding Zn-finger/Zn-ribbon topoisomerase 1